MHITFTGKVLYNSLNTTAYIVKGGEGVMSKSPEVNRFILQEFKNNDTQRVLYLTNKLFSTTSYSSRGQHSVRWKFGKWLCKRRVNNALKSFQDIGLIDNDESEEDKYTFSDLAKGIFNPPSNGNVEYDKLFEWTYVVGDKQYFLYSWNDTKVQGLLTVDGALMAGILFILQLLDSGTSLSLTVLPLILYAISFLLLACSIVYCLIHTIPKLNSKMGHGHNLKTMIGINRFVVMQRMFGGKKYFNAESQYFKNVTAQSANDLLESNIYQILGMNTNNIKSHAIIRKGVIATIISVISMILATIIFAVQNVIAILL